MTRAATMVTAAALVLGGASTAAAQAPISDVEQWLPSPAGASWDYAWSNDAFAPRTVERYVVDAKSGNGFRLAWTTQDLNTDPAAVQSQGTIDYRYSDLGLVNTNWGSTAPPSQYPVLCPSTSECGNSLAGSHYQVIWGTRSPVLQEPLSRGATWSSLGGQASDVSSVNRYMGYERVVTAAFPKGVRAAKVESDLSQAGALGDPFGSGLRTVWWVYGVGPVKVQLRHSGGQTSTAELQSTNMRPLPEPSDEAYLPLNRGSTMRFRYRNSKWLKRPSVQKATVAEVVNGTARLDLESTSGPLRAKSSYLFVTRKTGVTNTQGSTSAATRLRFPRLGPRSQPADRRRRFFSPIDLMTYGFNPVLQGYPAKGQSWRSSRTSRDFSAYGVTGRTTVRGTQAVTTPAGRFKALLVESKLTQAGFRYGSGTRRSWFVAGKGLVKLRFEHADGSVSTVERLK